MHSDTNVTKKWKRIAFSNWFESDLLGFYVGGYFLLSVVKIFFFIISLLFFSSFSVFVLLYSDNHRIFSVYLVKYLFSVINLDGILLYFTNFYVFNSIIEIGLFLSHTSIFKARLINLNTFCISHVYRWFGISNNIWIFLHKPGIKINIFTHTTRFLLPIWNVLREPED